MIVSERYENVDFREKDFSNEELQDVGFINCNMEGSDFRNAIFANVHLTMNCKTFEKVKLDLFNFKLFIFLMAKLDVEDDVIPEDERLRLIQNLAMNKGMGYSGLMKLLLTKREYALAEKYLAQDE